MEHRFESETKSADFHGIRLLHRIIDHLQPNPVILTELCIIICIQSSSLSYETKMYIKMSGILSPFSGVQLAQAHLETSNSMASVITEYILVIWFYLQLSTKLATNSVVQTKHILNLTI